MRVMLEDLCKKMVDVRRVSDRAMELYWFLKRICGG